MSLDLNKLANKLDEALSNETSETLTKFLTDKRMSNNKQTYIDYLGWFFVGFGFGLLTASITIYLSIIQSIK